MTMVSFVPFFNIYAQTPPAEPFTKPRKQKKRIGVYMGDHIHKGRSMLKRKKTSNETNHAYSGCSIDSSIFISNFHSCNIKQCNYGK